MSSIERVVWFVVFLCLAVIVLATVTSLTGCVVDHERPPPAGDSRGTGGGPYRDAATVDGDAAVDAYVAMLDAEPDAAPWPLTFDSIEPASTPRDGARLLQLRGSGFSRGPLLVVVQLRPVPHFVIDDTTIWIVAPPLRDLEAYPAMVDVRIERAGLAPLQREETYE